MEVRTVRIEFGGAVNVHGRHIVVERNRIASASRHRYVEECVFAENSIRDTDMDNTGNCFEGKAYRLYIANNKIQDTYGWDREAITFDVPYGHNWMGQVKMSSPTVMTPQGGAANLWGRTSAPGDLKGQGVMIVSGKGLGQFIRIWEQWPERHLVERPWDIEPDATSWVVIRTIKNQVVLTGNQIEVREKRSSCTPIRTDSLWTATQPNVAAACTATPGTTFAGERDAVILPRPSTNGSTTPSARGGCTPVTASNSENWDPMPIFHN